MTYLKFDKNQLVNLEYSLNKEVLRTNRAGSYACTTIVHCNTRKYHGLLVAPIESLDGEKHVLLSTLDTTVIQHNAEFNLGIHKYAGDNYNPKGHKYIVDYEFDSVSKITYRVGGVILTCEFLLISTEEQVIFKYTLEEAHSETRLRFRPFLAFRHIHSLSKANMDVNSKVEYIPNGIKSRLYPGYPALYMQLSKEPDFIHLPDWYYNIEYMEELNRGYDYQEDLFVPGYFELPIKKGESIYFAAGLESISPSAIARRYKTELDKRLLRDSYKNCLINAAQQFVVKHAKKTEIIAGYPWFGSWGRDTFISLPGLTLAIDDVKTFREVTDTMLGKLKNGLFPNMGSDTNPAFNSVDAPMWFFWALQKYTDFTGDTSDTWKRYGKAMKTVLTHYKQGIAYNIGMHKNGLIYAGEQGRALTWMDAVIAGKPVTPRMGYDVEINALWYNAVCFTLELAKKAGEKSFVDEWADLPEQIKESFNLLFTAPDKTYLADCVFNDKPDWSIRPNQIIAISLPYSPIDEEMQKMVIDTVKTNLLTPKGLRTLSPKDPLYKGVYEGNQESRDSAYHQGTVWPWLLQPFCEAYVKVYKKSAWPLLKEIYMGFEPDMMEYGLGTIAEIHDGDPPHLPKGSISQAWSVAALLSIGRMLEDQKQL